MKLLLTLIVTLFFSAAQGNAQETHITLPELVRALGKSTNFGVVGLEQVPNGLSTMSFGLNQRLDSVSPSFLSRLISKTTDYKCVIGKDCFLIVPKGGKSVEETALSLRTISFPSAKNADITKFLASISAVNSIDSIYINDSAPFVGQVVDGTIDSNGGRGLCYELLNNMARQLKANYWIMGHIAIDNIQGSAATKTTNLGVANVSFFRLTHLQ